MSAGEIDWLTRTSRKRVPCIILFLMMALKPMQRKSTRLVLNLASSGAWQFADGHR